MRITLLAALTLFVTLNLNAQWKSINGEGDVVKQEIELETLTGVRLGFHGDIYITQGTPQKIVMEGQQNVLDNIKREVNGGVWKVYFDKSVKNAKPVKIYITMATLEEAGVSGSGNLESKGAFENIGDLDTYVSGSGDVKLEIDAEDVESAVSGSGEIKLSGRAERLECSISGSGDVRAMDLRVGDCEVAISGSGDVEVHATGELEVSISGSGDVKYKGEPAKVKSRVSGSGDVREAN